MKTSNAEEKNFQPSDMNVNPTTDMPAPVVKMNEGNLFQNHILRGLVSEELSLEKPITPPAHIRNDRFSWEIYVTPTLNTHYLTGLNYQTMAQSIQSSPIMLVNVSNVNGFVDNTPVLGYNVGGNILYKLSKNISLKAGLEFSFNRYYIKAYNSNPPRLLLH